LALGLLSTLTAERFIRAVREKDLATLQGVPRVGRKKAEQIILDLADKLDDLQVASSLGGGPKPEGAGAEDAVRALVSLGYSAPDAERAVRQAIDDGGRGAASGAADLIRSALGQIGRRE
jgi:holliday junction DNA helicase RuvA